MSRDESRRSKRCRADRDYEMGPGSGILMNDYDDERTLDEEEALEASEDTHNELSHLQKESDMPLQDLLVMYGYGDDLACPDQAKAEDEDEDEEDEDEEDDDDEDEDDDDPATYEPDLKQFYTEMVKAEENSANVKGPSIVKPEDTGRSDDTASLTPGITAHLSTANIEPKAEGAVDLIDSSSGANPSAGTNVDAGSNVENVNSATDAPSSGIAPGVGGGGGGGGSSRLLRSVSRPQSEEEEDDCDYSPDEEEWKKTIMVGSDYQAAIPEGLCKYDDALPYENEDKMLWDPSHIVEEHVEEFLDKAQLPAVKGTSLPSGSHVRDDEQALYLLLQCGYNLEEALRRRRMNVVPATESGSLWSEEECHNFETGLKNYGKDFHLIQKNKVRTRSVGELVQFYYLWKKTERHDLFTYKARLEKKKYALHPGITDYMDRFLEEQEGVRDRSSSPNVHCLLYGDAKRQRTNANSTSNEDQSGVKSDGWENPNNPGATTTTTSTSTSSSSSSSSSSGGGATSTTTTAASATTGGGPTGADGSSAPALVNSGFTADPLAVEYRHNNPPSSSSSAPSPGEQVAGVPPVGGASSSSSSSSLATAAGLAQSTLSASAMPTTAIAQQQQQQQPQPQPQPLHQQRNHFHHHHHLHQHHQLALQAGGNNHHHLHRHEDNEEAVARSPENILPHLPP